MQDEVEAAFGVQVRESYGLTEGVRSCSGRRSTAVRRSHGGAGVAWPEGEVKLVGTDGNENDSYGELWVKNPGVTPGYYRLPEVNRERIVDGWLRTGDLFSRDAEGFYYFRGRTDDMFNSGGENIYPLEVENLLLKHPGVADVSVVPFPHKIKGDVPVAMVVRASDATHSWRGRVEAIHAAERPRLRPPAGGGSCSSTACRSTAPPRLTARSSRHRFASSSVPRRSARPDMGFGLDHVGIAVRDLERAADLYRRLGFTLAERGYHTQPSARPGGAPERVGTENHCIMLRRGYLELIGITDPALYEGRLRDDLARHEGGTSSRSAATMPRRPSPSCAAMARWRPRPAPSTDRSRNGAVRAWLPSPSSN